MADAALQVTFHASVALSKTARDEIEATASLCQRVFRDAAESVGLPRMTELVITTDFEATVRAHLKDAKGSPDEAAFEADRSGGSRVAAKTMAKDRAYDDVVIVMDSTRWPDESTGSSRAYIASLIGHEVAHTVLERIAYASEVTKGVRYPSYTPGEISRSLSRIINHEYRADRLADLVTSAVFSTERDGVRVPLHTWDLSAESYRSMLRDTFFETYAEGPGAVQDYRCHKIDLQAMFHKVTALTESTLVNFIHARALADAAVYEASAGVPLLDDPEIAKLPFVRLYLADTIPPLLEAIRSAPLLVSPTDWAALDDRVVAAGEMAIREIWRRLGLTFDEMVGPEGYRINVAAPLVAETSARREPPP